MCAVVLVAFNSSGFSKKEKMDTFQFDVALTDNFNYLNFFLSAVNSPWKNLCIAQKKQMLMPGFLSRELRCSELTAAAPESCCHAKTAL